MQLIFGMAGMLSLGASAATLSGTVGGDVSAVVLSVSAYDSRALTYTACAVVNSSKTTRNYTCSVPDSFVGTVSPSISSPGALPTNSTAGSTGISAYVQSPGTLSVSANSKQGWSQSDLNFSVIQDGYIVSGSLDVSGVSVSATGLASGSSCTVSGTYFGCKYSGSKANTTITPILSGRVFSPPSLTYTSAGSLPSSNVSFTSSQATTGPTGIITVPQIKLAQATSKGISATITPTSAEVGQAFPVYLSARLGDYLLFRGAGLNDWSFYKGGAIPVAQQVTAMPSSLPVNIIEADLSSLPGLEIYASYRDLNLADHTAKVFTVQKRTTILFPNPASPIYFADYSPFGQGIVARRGAAGEIEKLDIVEADGTYSQLTVGSTGLSDIKIGGYQITLTAKDASGKASQISVKDSIGVVSTYGTASTAQRRNQFASAVSDACDNPDGTKGLEDTNFPKTAACYMVFSFGHPTFEVLRGAYDFAKKYADLAIKYADLIKLMVERMSGSAAEADTEMTSVSAGLRDSQVTTSSQDTRFVSAEARIPVGTDEKSSKDIVDDLVRLSKDQNAKTENVDSTQLKTVDGRWAHPAFCSGSYAPVKNVCVPEITSVAPAAATLGQATTFVASGVDLTDGMEMTLGLCTAAPFPKSTGTSTRQQVACTPRGAGTLYGIWTQAGTGSLVSSFSVLVCNSNQTVVNGACVTPTTTTTTTSSTTTTTKTTTTTTTSTAAPIPTSKCSPFEDLQSGKCVAKPLTCTADQELVKYETKESRGGNTDPNMLYQYCISKSSRKIEGVWERYALPENLIQARTTYLNGVEEGPAATYSAPYNPVFYVTTEGNKSNGQSTGIWKMYGDSPAGVYLTNEWTYGIQFDGRTVTAVEKSYCGNYSRFPTAAVIAAYGKLSVIETIDLTTGRSTRERLNACV